MTASIPQKFAKFRTLGRVNGTPNWFLCVDETNEPYIIIAHDISQKPKRGPAIRQLEATYPPGLEKEFNFKDPPFDVIVDSANGEELSHMFRKRTCVVRIPKNERSFPEKPYQCIRARLLARMICGGKYELQRIIGKGGNGCVYRAIDQSKQLLAIKEFLPSGMNLAEERFLQEVSIGEHLAQLRHPNIVPVYGLERNKNKLYLVMAFENGTPITKVSNRGLKILTRYLHQIAGALATVHAYGIVHRDIKPDNIIVDPFNQIAKLLDFGIAKVQGLNVVQTNTGVLMGTPSNMSPEQFAWAINQEGENPVTVGIPSDIFSFGKTIYEVITGKKPHKTSEYLQIASYYVHGNPHPATPIQIVTPDMVMPREYDESLLNPERVDFPYAASTIQLYNELLCRTTHPDPGRRYQTMEEVLMKLKEIYADLSSRPTQRMKIIQQKRSAPRRRVGILRRIWLVLTYYFLLALLTAVIILLGHLGAFDFFVEWGQNLRKFLEDKF